MLEQTIKDLIWIAGIIIGSGLLEISPLKINPWTWLFTPIRKALVGGLMEEIKKIDFKVEKVHKELEDHVKVSKEDRIQASRNRILRFSDEILVGQQHTKEHFDDMLIAIDEYLKYCNDHPDFPNSRCLLAIENIKETYKEKMKDNSFVKIERLVKVEG